MTTVSTIGVAMDCPDPDVAATFWETFLNHSRQSTRPDSPYVTIERPEGSDGIALVTFQRVPEPKSTTAGVHLDLFVDHAQPLFEAMIAVGATAIHTTPAQEWTTRVLTDPAGNEFCLIGPDWVRWLAEMRYQAGWEEPRWDGTRPWGRAGVLAAGRESCRQRSFSPWDSVGRAQSG